MTKKTKKELNKYLSNMAITAITMYNWGYDLDEIKKEINNILV